MSRGRRRREILTGEMKIDGDENRIGEILLKFTKPAICFSHSNFKTIIEEITITGLTRFEIYSGQDPTK